MADAPEPTRWEIRRAGHGLATYVSAKARTFAVGDLLNIPPPVPEGSVWIVTAIEPPITEGCDGTLVVEPASPPAEGQ
jgi:hypothetical protein